MKKFIPKFHPISNNDNNNIPFFAFDSTTEITKLLAPRKKKRYLTKRDARNGHASYLKIHIKKTIFLGGGGVGVLTVYSVIS